MLADKSQPHNRFHLPTWLVWGVVCGGLIAYWLLFFSQPSVLGITDAQGEPVSRMVDVLQILLWEQQLDSMAGNGRFELGVLDRVPSLAGIVGWLALAAWIGWPVVQRVSRRRSLGGQRQVEGMDVLQSSGRSAQVRLTGLEEIALSMLVGLSLLSTLTLLVGLAGGLSSRVPLLLGIGALMVAAGIASRGVPWRDWLGLLGPVPRAVNWLRSNFHLRTPEKNLRTTPSLGVHPGTLIAVWLMRLVPVGTCVLAGLLLYGCLMPPWEFDVVEYHLQAPKEFFQAGGVQFNPHNIYANMPLGAEMHSLAAMTLVGGPDGWWAGGLIGKGITGSISLLAAALLGGFVARAVGSWGGWVAAGLLLSTPGNAHVAMAGLIDMVVAGYLLAAAILVTELWPRLRSGTVQFDELLLLCLLAGTAAACKYTGLVLVTLPILAAVLWATCLARNGPALARMVVAGGLGMLLTCMPWYAKNFAWTGNPVFPLATNVFGASGLTAEQVARWQQAHRVPVAENHGAYSLAVAWETVTHVFLTSTFLQPTLVVLLLCGVAVSCCGALERPSTALPNGDLSNGRDQIWWGRGWLLLAVWIGGVWWLATHRIDRFWLPALPVVCAIASLGVMWISRRLSLALAAGVVLLGMVYGSFILVSGAIGDNRFFVSLRALRSDAGDDNVPGRLIPPIGWANQALFANDVRLLLIGEARAFDFRMPIVYSTCFDRSLAEAWLKGQTPEQQRANLKRAGITHVMINWSELKRYRSPGNYGYSDWPQRADIASLVESGVLEPYASPFDREGVDVLQVVDAP